MRKLLTWLREWWNKDTAPVYLQDDFEEKVEAKMRELDLMDRYKHGSIH